LLFFQIYGKENGELTKYYKTYSSSSLPLSLLTSRTICKIGLKRVGSVGKRVSLAFFSSCKRATQSSRGRRYLLSKKERKDGRKRGKEYIG
jgi:hypothetical protein